MRNAIVSILVVASGCVASGCAPMGSKQAAAPGRYEASTSSHDSGGAADTSIVGEESRPGLGTEFGERRSSSVRFVSFERCSGGPSSSTAVHYDDEAGIAAMVDHDLRLGGRVHGLALGEGGEVSVALLDESGDPLPGVEVGERTYIVGEAGARYEIAIVNDGPRRWEVVASVDGLDVVDGREASYGKRGYILEPYSELTIDGFRTSADDVAAFRFGRVDDSYAARTGSSRNVGVIGLALFCERNDTPIYVKPDRRDRTDEVRRRQSADPFPNKWAVPPDGQ